MDGLLTETMERPGPGPGERTNKNSRHPRTDPASLNTHNDRVQVDPVHVQPLDLLQVSVLGVGRDQPHQLLVDVLYGLLQLNALVGDEPELRDVA